MLSRPDEPDRSEARNASVFSGLLGYPITPSDEQGVVDTVALAALVDRLAQEGVDGIGALGSTGCAVFLDREQRRRAVQAALEGAAGRVPVTVGVGALRTDQAILLAQDAADAGATGLLLPPVSYTPLNADEVFEHVRLVSAATDLPLCVYENPATTGFRFDDALVGRIAALPKAVAIKRPAPDAGRQGAQSWLRAQRATVGQGFSVGCSVDWHAPTAILAGADAWHSVLAGILPRLCVPLMRSATARDSDGLAKGMEALAPLWALFQKHSSLRVVHAMARLMGVPNARAPLPIRPLEGDALTRVAELLARIAV